MSLPPVSCTTCLSQGCEHNGSQGKRLEHREKRCGSIHITIVEREAGVRPRHATTKSLYSNWTKGQQSLLFVWASLCCVSWLTVWGELVFLKHGDTQDVLVEVFDEELAVKVPLWVQSVADWFGGVALGSHRQLTVRIAFAWTESVCGSLVCETLGVTDARRLAQLSPLGLQALSSWASVTETSSRPIPLLFSERAGKTHRLD